MSRSHASPTCPAGFLGLERYRPLLSATEWSALVQSIQKPLTPALRVNTLKIPVEDAQCTWPRWYSWRIGHVPFCNAGWQITAQGQGLSQTLEHRMGLYYVQDAASMLPAEMFRLWPE